MPMPKRGVSSLKKGWRVGTIFSRGEHADRGLRRGSAGPPRAAVDARSGYWAFPVTRADARRGRIMPAYVKARCRLAEIGRGRAPPEASTSGLAPPARPHNPAERILTAFRIARTARIARSRDTCIAGGTDPAYSRLATPALLRCAAACPRLRRPPRIPLLEALPGPRPCLLADCVQELRRA